MHDVGIEDCTTLVDSDGTIALLAHSTDLGPFVIRVGNIPVGTFGFSSIESEKKIDATRQLLDAHALDVAMIAFRMIRQKQHLYDDPARLRDMARAACKHARVSFLTSNRQAKKDSRK